MTTQTLASLANEIRRMDRQRAELPYACPYVRLATKRLDAAWEALTEARPDCASRLIEAAAIHLNYAASAARIRTLRSEATAEAARSFHA